MAAGSFTVLNTAKKKLVDGTFDLDTHTFKVALLTAAVAFTAASTVDTYAEITSQVANGNGYATGGATLTGVTLNAVGGTTTFDAADVTWANATIAAKYAVLYSDTATAKDIVGFMDLNTDSGSAVIQSTSGNFTVEWNASGLFSIA